MKLKLEVLDESGKVIRTVSSQAAAQGERGALPTVASGAARWNTLTF